MRRSATAGRPSRWHVVCLALALAVPLAVFSAPLIDQRSLGPVSYQVSDAANYAAFNDRLEDNTWRDEHFGLGPADDRLAHQLLTGPLFQGTGTFPLGAALNVTYGWAALDSQSALMIALARIGALGCFGLVLTATRLAVGEVSPRPCSTPGPSTTSSSSTAARRRWRGSRCSAPSRSWGAVCCASRSAREPSSGC